MMLARTLYRGIASGEREKIPLSIAVYILTFDVGRRMAARHWIGSCSKDPYA